MRTALLGLLLFLTSCTPELALGPPVLENTAWELRFVELDGVRTESEHADLLWFRDSTSVAIQSCNSCSGSFSVEGNQLMFAPMACTRRACADHPELAEMIGTNVSVARQGDWLILENEDRLLQFGPAPIPKGN